MTDKVDGEIVEAIDFMVERVRMFMENFHLLLCVLSLHLFDLACKSFAIQVSFLFAVGKFDTTGIGFSINDELRQLLRPTAESMPLAHYDYRRFRRVCVVEFSERGSVQMLSECEIGPFEKRRQFPVFKSGGRSKFAFTGTRGWSLSV